MTLCSIQTSVPVILSEGARPSRRTPILIAPFLSVPGSPHLNVILSERGLSAAKQAQVEGPCASASKLNVILSEPDPSLRGSANEGPMHFPIAWSVAPAH